MAGFERPLDDRASFFLGAQSAHESDYIFQRRLAWLDTGSYSQVDVVERKADGRVLVMKKLYVPDPEPSHEDPDDRSAESEAQAADHAASRRVLRELSLLCSLDHPNIIKAHGAGEHGTREGCFIVLEYVDLNLGSLIDSGPQLNLAQVKCLMRQLLEGIAYLHRNGVVHRDITPQNLLLTNDGVLKISDFGIARSLPATATAATSASSHEDGDGSLTPAVTTLWYAAPEVIASGNMYTSAVDIWSAGCILGELFLGEALFQGESPAEMLRLIGRTLGGGPSEEELVELRHANVYMDFFDQGDVLDDWSRRRPEAGRTEEKNAQNVAGIVGGSLEVKLLAAGGELSRLPEGARKAVLAFLKELLCWSPARRPTAEGALSVEVEGAHVRGDAKSNATSNWWNWGPEAKTSVLANLNLKM